MAITTRTTTESITPGYLKYASGVILVLKENSVKVFQWEVTLSKKEKTDFRRGNISKTG